MGCSYDGPPFLGSISQPTDHVWNAVRLSRKSWYLIDSTWGSQYCSASSSNSVHELDKHYFLTRPEQFLYYHLPLESCWQLLPVSKRISYSEFVNRSKVWPSFFTFELEINQPKNSSNLTYDKKMWFC